MRSRGLAVVVALVLAVAPAGCADDGDPPAPSEYDATDADFAAVRGVLDDRAAAVLAGDEDAFRATLDDRDPAFVEEQLTIFENLQELPVDSMSYRTEDYGLPAADIAGDDPVLRPETTELVKLDGPDVRPVANDTDMTFVRRDGSWLLAAEEAPQQDSLEVRSRVWFGGPISVSGRGDLIVVTDQDQSSRTARLADQVKEHLHWLAADLGVKRRFDILVDASSTGQAHEMNALGTGSSDAVTFGVSNGERFAGYRIAINPEIADAVAAGKHDLLVRHELTHFVLWEWGGDRAPLWLTEGIAEHAAAIGYQITWNLPEKLRDEVLASRRELPSSGSFSTYPDRNYLIASAAVDELVADHGLDHFMDFMRAFPKDGWGDVEAIGLLKEFYGLTERQLCDRAWQRIERLPTA